MSCNHLQEGGYWECGDCNPPLATTYQPGDRPRVSAKDQRIKELELELARAKAAAQESENDADYYRRHYHHAANDETHWKEKYRQLQDEMAKKDADWSGICVGWSDALDRAYALARAWKRYAKAWREQAKYLFEKESLGAQVRNFMLYKAALKELDICAKITKQLVDAEASGDHAEMQQALRNWETFISRFPERAA